LLAFVLLPLLGAALRWVVAKVPELTLYPLNESDPTLFGLVWMYFASGFVPFLASMLLANPIARLYGRFSIVAAGLIAVPAALLLTLEAVTLDLNAIQLGVLLVFLPASAAIANRQLSGSRLVILPSLPTQVQPGLDPPLWLSLSLLPVLAIALRVIDHELQHFIWDVGFIPDTRVLERTGLLLGAVISPALVAVLFAYPIARLYERRWAAAAVCISAPTALYWSGTYLMDARHPYVVVAYVIKIISLAIFVPFAASKAYRKLGASRLALVPASRAISGSPDRS
jgi:hypothetical protein